tara:strand:+ start:2284 stop:2490 length:207 start_codon:yes stop_codon:yes gene_type:complete
MEKSRAIVKNHTSDSFGCEADYFSKFIVDQRLDVIEKASKLIRVKDKNGEEWTLFNGFFELESQLGLF